jgi:hypothetical protein
MQQIADWLEKLAEYVQRFAENGIDVSVLRYLTEVLHAIDSLMRLKRSSAAACSARRAVGLRSNSKATASSVGGDDADPLSHGFIYR